MTKKPEVKTKPRRKLRKATRKETAHRLVLRTSTLPDYPDICVIMDRVYPTMGGAWSREQFAAQIKRFPDGQRCIEDNGRVVAAAISLIVDYPRFGDQHGYHEITGNGYLTTHDPKGDTLYGVDVFVHPDYRDLRLGRRLYDARKALCEHLNVRRIVAGGRIPGYANHVEEMSPSRYIELVKKKELRDPILSFQLANDFHVRRLITGSVGNLPNVENMDIQYSQSAILTPSDFAFPHDAVAAEATPNNEMSLIADLDINKLKELREQGSVRNALDRRRDLYRVEWLGDD